MNKLSDAKRDSPPLGWCTMADLEKVVDGDTFEVSIKRTFRVRLLNCWAPEIRGKEREEGLKAKDAASRLLGDRVKLYIPTGEDGDLTGLMTLGRFLGVVYMPDGRPLAAELVSLGLARETK